MTQNLHFKVNSHLNTMKRLEQQSSGSKGHGLLPVAGPVLPGQVKV